MLELPHSFGDFALCAKLFFAMAIGHALADYPLQGSFLATGKSRHHTMSRDAEQEKGLWVHCLLAHSLIHAGMVWAITGCAILGFIEFVLHAILDFLKCESITNLNVDQAAHLGCKAAYIIAIVLWH
jgi:Protein of unknown function (DUF3307)